MLVWEHGKELVGSSNDKCGERVDCRLIRGTFASFPKRGQEPNVADKTVEFQACGPRKAFALVASLCLVRAVSIFFDFIVYCFFSQLTRAFLA